MVRGGLGSVGDSFFSRHDSAENLDDWFFVESTKLASEAR